MTLRYVLAVVSDCSLIVIVLPLERVSFWILQNYSDNSFLMLLVLLLQLILAVFVALAIKVQYSVLKHASTSAIRRCRGLLHR